MSFACRERVHTNMLQKLEFNGDSDQASAVPLKEGRVKAISFLHRQLQLGL